ncbi:NlpC/P60 family protein [Algoriphagus halophytocola]|uniref:NlpC/P60 family protein n=1 Tax=Algoriphagus halophytocola TaxID=2991499 RepID=A0ABY6ML88_9BACT|nr:MULTISPECIES: NlpC/P60 family protein [unclassified Algoriphagus]UZD23729.1 NlpC/P60 family protein [Algoriphagus sp. TR-M5]WBL45023.1 NlpC/P60 family protein [Algoriphagus sp. TR-M9]
MKRIYYPIFSLVAVAALLLSCEAPNNNAEVTALIESKRAELAPDKRVALWDLTFENDSLKGETDQLQGLEELLSTLKDKGISFTNAVKRLPDEALGDQTKAIVTISVANIRSNPRHSAELATQALMGTPLNVLKQEDSWYLVQTPDGYLSWVDRAGIQLMTPKEQETWLQDEKVVYTQLYGHVWVSPEQKEMVSDVVAGDILTFEGELHNYVEVSLPDGRLGYIPSREILPWEDWIASRSTSPEKLITTAKQMMGVPYLWGGTSIKGVDCSGFTKTIYYLNGQIIPRDASQQIHEGELVDENKNWENLQVGDLLFFGVKGTAEQKERVVHVGMWIGNGEFIHSRGRVRISSFDPENANYDEYELGRYLRTKRIVNVPSEHILSVSALLPNQQ